MVYLGLRPRCHVSGRRSSLDRASGEGVAERLRVGAAEMQVPPLRCGNDNR